MSEPYVGEIRIFGFNFAPYGWAFCDGSLLDIQQNQALFSLVGTIYGGNGSTTFGVPDLRGRVATGTGQGPGLSNYVMGQSGGAATVALTNAQMPAHAHPVKGSSSSAGAVASPTGNVWSANASAPQFATTGTLTPMAGTMVGTAGSSTPHNNMAPYLGMNFCISLFGVFPSRN